MQLVIAMLMTGVVSAVMLWTTRDPAVFVLSLVSGLIYAVTLAKHPARWRWVILVPVLIGVGSHAVLLVARRAGLLIR